MRLRVLLFACLLFLGMTRGDETEVGDKPNEENRKDAHLPDAPPGGGNPEPKVKEPEKDSGYASSNIRGHVLQPPRPHQAVAYHSGPPPSHPGGPGPQGVVMPASKASEGSIDKVFNTALGDSWPLQLSGGEMPKIVSLDVKCEKASMKVHLAFDKPFYGIVFSKGHYNNVNCVHLPAGLGRTSINFEIGIHACGTAGNTDNALLGYGGETGAGTYFENIVVIQYDPQVQEVWDQARKLRCTWHDLYEKSVTFRPFPVDMLDVVRTDFAGDNVGCWMQIQVGKGPWASEVSGLVKIGQTMTMVLAIKDDDSKFDMLVRNCMAHDGKRAPIQLVDQRGCITRPKLMSRFTKIKNFGASASVLSYAHFQAFKFPDSMEVHFQCTIQICRYHCPDQCADHHHGASNTIIHDETLGHVESHRTIGHTGVASYGYPPPAVPLPLEHYLQVKSVGAGRPRDERRRKSRSLSRDMPVASPKTVGVNRVIRVVSSGDLTFAIDDQLPMTNGNETVSSTTGPTIDFPVREANFADLPSDHTICMTTSGFTLALALLLSVLLASCGLSAYLCARIRPFARNMKKAQQTTSATATPAAFVALGVNGANSTCCYS